MFELFPIMMRRTPRVFDDASDKEFDDLMNGLFDDYKLPGRWSKYFDMDDMFKSMMKTDVEDNGDSVTLSIDLPGFNKEDISITTKDGFLQIEATRNSEKTDEDKEKSYIRKERAYGSFTRNFDISSLDESALTASYKDGVLKISAPKLVKTEAEGRKKIEIGD